MIQRIIRVLVWFYLYFKNSIPEAMEVTSSHLKTYLISNPILF